MADRIPVRDWIVWWLLNAIAGFASEPYQEGLREGFNLVMGGDDWQYE